MVYVARKDNSIADVLRGWVYNFQRWWEEGIIDPDVKCLVVQSKRAPTAHTIYLVVASVSPIARPSAWSVPSVFSNDKDFLTQDLGPADAKYRDFSGLFHVITSAPDGAKETTTGGLRM